MICIPLKAKTLKTLSKKILQAQKKADLVEIWFDEIKNLDSKELKDLFKKIKKPILYKATNDFIKIQKILAHKVKYIDLDISVSSELIKKVREISPKTNIIISYHNFTKTPLQKELINIVTKIKRKKADIIKIATYAKQFNDSLRMMELLSNESQKSKIICICMGKYGRITRTTGHILGNYLMYAPLSNKEKTAPGQVTFDELKQIQQVLKK